MLIRRLLEPGATAAQQSADERVDETPSVTAAPPHVALLSFISARRPSSFELRSCFCSALT